MFLCLSATACEINERGIVEKKKSNTATVFLIVKTQRADLVFLSVDSNCSSSTAGRAELNQ